jgi:hypothetical protein
MNWAPHRAQNNLHDSNLHSHEMHESGSSERGPLYRPWPACIVSRHGGLTSGVTTMGSDRENPGAPNLNGPNGGPQV